MHVVAGNIHNYKDNSPSSLEEESKFFLYNTGKYIPNCTVLHSRG
jgi:hypothetical protein